MSPFKTNEKLMAAAAGVDSRGGGAAAASDAGTAHLESPRDDLRPNTAAFRKTVLKAKSTALQKKNSKTCKGDWLEDRLIG